MTKKVIAFIMVAFGVIVVLVLMLTSSNITPTMSNIIAPYPAHEGYFCNPKYPYALTEDRQPMVCTTTSTDPHYRFRSPE